MGVGRRVFQPGCGGALAPLGFDLLTSGLSPLPLLLVGSTRLSLPAYLACCSTDQVSSQLTAARGEGIVTLLPDFLNSCCTCILSFVLQVEPGTCGEFVNDSVCSPSPLEYQVEVHCPFGHSKTNLLLKLPSAQLESALCIGCQFWVLGPGLLSRMLLGALLDLATADVGFMETMEW